MIWQIHFYNDNPKSQQIWDEFYKPDNHFKFYHICKLARQHTNAEVLVRLLDLVDTAGLSKKALGLIHSALITIYGTQSEFDLLQAALRRAVDSVDIENLNIGALNLARSTLQTVGKEFPYELPENFGEKEKGRRLPRKDYLELNRNWSLSKCED